MKMGNGMSANDRIVQFRDYVGKKFVIKLKKNPKYVIDSNGKQHGGGPFHLWERVGTSHANQTWTVDEEGHIISCDNTNSIIYATDTNDRTQPIIIGKGNNPDADTDLAKWSLDTDGVIHSLSNVVSVFDLKNDSVQNGTAIQMFEIGGGPYQQWELEIVGDIQLNGDAVIKTKSEATNDVSEVPDKDNNTIELNTKTVSIPFNLTSKVTDTKSETNAFYELLQNKFDSVDRESFKVNNNVVKLTLQRNEASKYNASGNIYVSANIPKSNESVPNYADIILNTNEAIDESKSLMNILTSFVTNKDFIATYFYDEKVSKVENNVPIIDISGHLKDYESVLCMNWNAGRNYTQDKVKSIANYYLAKFNEVIDYVITNDLVVVDSEFNTKWLSMFSDADENVYNYANGTLLLPSIVNWISSKNDGTNHALSVCGYVEKDSKIFPATLGSNWDETVKWNNKENITCNPCVYVPKNINKLIKMSAYNYPFVANNLLVMTKDAPVSAIDYISNINVPFEGDSYSNEAHTSSMNGVKYASQEIGKKEAVTNVIIEATSNEDFYKSITVDINDCMDSIIMKIPYSYTTSEYATHTKSACSTVRWYEDKAVMKDMTFYKLNPTKLKNKINTSFIQAVLADKKINMRSCYKNEDDVPSISNITYELVTGSGIKDNTIYCTSTNANETYYVFTDDCKRQCVCAKLWESCKTHCPKKATKKVVSNIYPIYYSNAANNNTYKVKATIKYKTYASGWNFIGSFNISVTGTNDNINKTICSDKAICLYKTNMNLYYFSDITFKHWMSVIKQSANQQLILNELRKYISEHLELVLLNKVNKVLGEYTRGLSTDVGFMGIPFGPTLLTIPNSLVVPYRYYFPTFKINNEIDKSKINYDASKTCNNIINSVTCNNNGESKNYLDVLFSSVISSSRRLDHLIDNNTYVYYILPLRGHQLFEVISKSMIVNLPKDSPIVSGYGQLDDENSLIYKNNSGDEIISKIIISRRNFSNDDKLSTLNSVYKYIGSVNVPIINFKHSDKFVTVEINTLSTSSDNICYIYVSNDKTQEIISNVKGNGTEDKDKNLDKNNIINTMLNISYNGIDSNQAPACLTMHYISESLM